MFVRLPCRRTQVYGVNKVRTELVSFTEVLPLKGRRDSHKDKSDDGWGTAQHILVCSPKPRKSPPGYGRAFKILLEVFVVVSVALSPLFIEESVQP